MAVICNDLPAVVLDCLDHGEADKIVTFFCKDSGRLTAIAKGAHRSKKRFVNKLELFSFLNITCSRSGSTSLALLAEAELLNGFISLRADLGRYQAASVVREFVLAAISERLNDDNLFRLTLWALHGLDSGTHSRTVLALFLVKLFDYIGYRPDFSHCQYCGNDCGRDGQAEFRPLSGGLCCARCRAGEAYHGRPLSGGTVGFIQAVQQQQIDKLSRFRPSQAIVTETLECLYRYARHLFQRDIHSWKYL